VVVSARLMSSGRNDSLVEKMMGRLSLEPSVWAAGWDVS